MPGPIGYLVKAVVDALEDRRAKEAARAAGGSAPPAGLPVGAEEGGEEGKGVELTPTLSPTEETGAEGSSQPQPKSSSKSLAYWAMLAVGFAFALDYTASLMSIQTLWYVVGGPQKLYGFTFGSYDLTAMLFAPAFGWWVDRSGRYKPQISLGGALNAAGNLVYGFTILAGSWSLMLVARLVAGVGTATLGIGSSYIAATTTLESRAQSLGRYRISQNVARVTGPFVGYLFLNLPLVNDGSSTALKLFNWYTVPGWFAFFGVLLVMVGFLLFFRDPTPENGHLVEHEGELAAPTAERRAAFRRLQLQWLGLTFAAVFVAMAFYSNLFALFAGRFHAIDDQYGQWRTFIGVGAGAIAAATLHRRCLRAFPAHWEERRLVLAGAWLVLLAYMLVLPYHGEGDVPPVGLFYAATAILGFAVVINQTCLETFYSKKITQFTDVTGGQVGMLLGVYYMAISAGRFAGPMVMGAATFISTPAGQTNVCTTGWVVAPDGSTSCAGPPGQQCAITGDNYYVLGCVLKNSTIVYPVFAGLQLLIIVASHVILARNWHYD